MEEFIYAAELKQRYKVYGSFYNLKVSDRDPVKCRNILEIYRKGFIAGIAEPVPLFFGNPDSVFVMMNPGSSEPKEDGFREPEFDISIAEKMIISNRLVNAKPDVTQYQVMRIMEEMEWNHVRVVNLSDIREPKSLRFFKRVDEFERRFGDIHTVFSEIRKEERIRAFHMKRGDSPVVLGWGMDKHLMFLAKKAFAFLKEFNTTGISSDNSDLLYFHPSPNIQKAKIKWLKSIIKELKVN